MQGLAAGAEVCRFTEQEHRCSLQLRPLLTPACFWVFPTSRIPPEIIAGFLSGVLGLLPWLGRVATCYRLPSPPNQRQNQPEEPAVSIGEIEGDKNRLIAGLVAVGILRKVGRMQRLKDMCV